MLRILPRLVGKDADLVRAPAIGPFSATNLHGHVDATRENAAGGWLQGPSHLLIQLQQLVS